MKLVEKSNGEIEKFSPEKLENSLKITFNMLITPEGQAEQYIKQIFSTFSKWQDDKPEITSADIRRQVAKILENIDPSAAYIFENFKSII